METIKNSPVNNATPSFKIEQARNMPIEANVFFFDYATKLTEKTFNPDFEGFSMVQHADGSDSYIADWIQPKQYTVMNSDNYVYRFTFLCDFVQKKFAGAGIIEYKDVATGNSDLIRPPRSIITEPFIANTWTEESFRRIGIGERRYLLMNQISLAKYGKTLKSGVETSEEAQYVWKKLIEKGLARKVDSFNEEHYFDYEFI